MLKRAWEYLITVFGFWKKHVSGWLLAVIAISLSLAAAYYSGNQGSSEKVLQWSAKLSVAAAIWVVFVAQYDAWREQHEKVGDLEGRPEVNLIVRRARIGEGFSGETFFLLQNASKSTATNATVSAISKRAWRCEFAPMPTLLNNEVPAPLLYTMKWIRPSGADHPVPGGEDSKNVLTVFGLLRATDKEKFNTLLKFSNYGGTATWEVDYTLEFDYKNSTIDAIPGACRKISLEVL